MDLFSDDDMMDFDPFSDDEETQPPIQSTSYGAPSEDAIEKDSFDNDPNDAPLTPQQLLKRKKELDKISSDLDEMAAQLRFALDLSKQLEMCSSDGNIPITGKIKPRLLDSGCLLLILELTNSSKGVLCGWYVTVSWSQLRESFTEEETGGLNNSRNIPIDRLESGQSYSTEMCVAAVDIALPLICNLHIMKSFTLDSVTRVIDLDLADIAVTSLNHLETIANDENLEILRGSFQIALSPAFVHLILKCDKDEDPSKLLQLIRNEFASDKCDGVLTTVLTRFVPRPFQPSHLVRFTLKRDSDCILTVHAKDPDVRSRIKNDLYLFFVIIASRLLKTSKDYLHSDPDFRSVEKLFHSIVLRFR